MFSRPAAYKYRGDVKLKRVQTVNGQPRRGRRAVLRAAAVCGVAALLLAAPLDWAAAGRTVLLVAAGMQQPENTAAFLAGRLQTATAEPPAQTVAVAQVPAAAAGGTEPPAEPPAAATTTTVAVAATTAPPEDGTGGKVYEQKLDTGDTLLDGVAVRNRSGQAVDIRTALATTLQCRFTQTAEPQVLIVHTHTTEEYLPYDAGYYNAGDRNRTVGGVYSVCTVGQAVVQALAEEGIVAVQDTTVHDSPKYSGAYSRSAETVTKNLEKYPSIQVVLDLHRDAILQGERDLTKPTVVVEGKKAAQMMILIGTVSTAALPNPHWQQNLALAAQWQKALTDSYPGLMRPLSTVASRYNQHMHAGYLLVEIGSEGNAIDEAVYSGQLLGKTLARLLKEPEKAGG